MTEWTIETALHALKKPLDASEAESAGDWLYALIQEEVAHKHPITLGAIAVMMLDALQEKK